MSMLDIMKQQWFIILRNERNHKFQWISQPLACCLHFGTFKMYLKLIPFCEYFFLQLPQDQFFSQNENSNTKKPSKSQGNAQFKASFAH